MDIEAANRHSFENQGISLSTPPSISFGAIALLRRK
jgi:hypothetical protein